MESSTVSIMSGSRVPAGGRAGLPTADARASPPARRLPLQGGTHPAHTAAALHPAPGRPRLPVARPRRAHADRHRPPRLCAADRGCDPPGRVRDRRPAAPGSDALPPRSHRRRRRHRRLGRRRGAGPPRRRPVHPRPGGRAATRPGRLGTPPLRADNEPGHERGSPKNHRRRPASTASSATATSSASATAPWQSPSLATRPAASRSTFPSTRCSSPATRRRADRTGP